MAVTVATLQAKVAALEARMNDLAPVVKTNQTAVAPIEANASFLSSLNPQHPASKATASGLNYSGPAGQTTVAQVLTWLNGPFAGLMNNILNSRDTLAGNLNDLYDALQDANIID